MISAIAPPVSYGSALATGLRFRDCTDKRPSQAKGWRAGRACRRPAHAAGAGSDRKSGGLAGVEPALATRIEIHRRGVAGVRHRDEGEFPDSAREPFEDAFGGGLEERNGLEELPAVLLAL